MYLYIFNIKKNENFDELITVLKYDHNRNGYVMAIFDIEIKVSKGF
jgi:hypothetical protein